MPWTKIDDQYFFNPKVLAAGRDARDVHLASMVYSSGQLTDGFIPTNAVPLVGAMAMVANVQECAAKLVDVGLWECVEGGYLVHDYLKYNPPSEQVRATREARAEAGRRGGLASAESRREADAETSDEANGQANAQANAEQNPTPSPSPSPSFSPVPEDVGAAAPPPEPPAPKPKPSRKSRSAADPRTQHPAIQACKRVRGRYPNKDVYPVVIGALGDNPDIDKLRGCYQEWRVRGYNPDNMGWAVDWYVNGIVKPQPRASPTAGKQADIAKRADMIRRFAQGGGPDG